MTRNLPSTTSTPPVSLSGARRGRRWGSSVAALVAFGAALAVPVANVEAAVRTDSATIAAAADSAASALARWMQTRNPADYERYVLQRDLTAQLTERGIEIDDGSIRDAWADAPIAKQQIVLKAMSQLGVPYDYLGSEPGVGFDCSGLTIWAFESAGVKIPRVSRDQINAAVEIDRDDAEPGDLVYYPGHISIYLGADAMVHSPNSGSTVEVAPLSDRSLRFGDAAGTAEVRVTAVDADESLVDRATAVAK